MDDRDEERVAQIRRSKHRVVSTKALSWPISTRAEGDIQFLLDLVEKQNKEIERLTGTLELERKICQTQ